MVYMRKVRVNPAIDRYYYCKERAAEEQSRQLKALCNNGLSEKTQNKFKSAMDRAKAAERPIDKLVKMICAIMQAKLWPLAAGEC